MAHLNSGSVVRIFLKLSTMIAAKVDENDINVFQKKKIGENGPFWAQKWCILITLDLL